MAAKTVSIDLEAYKRLKSVQEPRESFSQVIRRVIQPPFDVKAWLDAVSRRPSLKSAAAAVERQVRARRQRPDRAR
jgi:predicted CopG family antitoxin